MSQMSQDLESLRVLGLFGYLDHAITFRREVATILTGPNGSGKTHVLKILRALVNLDLADLAQHPFDSASLEFRSGTTLTVQKSTEDERALWISRNDTKTGAVVGEDRFVAEITTRAQDLELPSWYERLGPREWYDGETGEFLDADDLVHRFGYTPAVVGFVDSRDWLRELRPPVPPTFIETGRLDLSVRAPAPDKRYMSRAARARAVSGSSSAIGRHVEQIRAQIGEAKRTSLTVSQQADRQFAARALDKARASVRESDLRREYLEIAGLHQELHANGLTDEAIEVSLPDGRLNPTERRILSVFLEDWERKLDPLLPVHERLQILRRIIEGKIRDKELVISPRGEITFASPSMDMLPVESLSSGEQHLLAVFTMLLFTAEAGSLVLIDEPEISLHAAWKHAFLADIEMVSKLIEHTVVLATHSSALINSRWELVEELELY
jgi:energy-coupling factor transporter ATP-binding protein EcfA2